MAKRGRQPTSDGPGALKKNKSNPRQAANQQSNRPRSVPPNNTGQTNRKIPKTQDEPSKTTAVQGQKTKTNLHRPCKTNPIRNNTMLLAGKNCHGSNNEKTNIAVWFCRQIYPHDIMLPSLLPPHQHSTTSHDHPTSHSTTSQKHINSKKTYSHYWDLD